jgi:hypothetical protein
MAIRINYSNSENGENRSGPAIVRRHPARVLGALALTVLSPVLVSGLMAAPASAKVSPGLGSQPNAGARSDAQIKACVTALHRPGVHTVMTVAQAQRCDPGKPVYTPTTLPASTPANGTFIVVYHENATINFSHTRTQATSARLTVASSSCWNNWTWRSAGWWLPDDSGGISGSGYGNHCGYANTGAPTPSIGCICTGYSYSDGHYDSNFGNANGWGRKAADWINADFNSGLIHWQAWARVWWDTNGNTSVASWVG